MAEERANALRVPPAIPDYDPAEDQIREYMSPLRSTCEEDPYEAKLERW